MKNHTSVSILTYKRTSLLTKSLSLLVKLNKIHEIIIIDNDENNSAENIAKEFNVKYLPMSTNIGASGRNAGISCATSDIVITIDDDVIGLTDEHITAIETIFQKQPTVGAICFKVLDPMSKNIINWCHHRDIKQHSDEEFHTYEISEGAVAFRKKTLSQSGYYTESFFISHEGHDLACRIINCGYSIIYTPQVEVMHYHSQIGRTNWRRYYYDTRNNFFVAARNYPLTLALRYLLIGTGSMFVYALRDGYVRHWAKGIIDGLRNLKYELNYRKVLSKEAILHFKEIDRHRPSILCTIRKRLFRKGVQI